MRTAMSATRPSSEFTARRHHHHPQLGGRQGICVAGTEPKGCLRERRRVLYVAGLIQDSIVIPGAVAVKTPEEARKSVDELILNKPDIVKVRVDDFLGARQKMSPEVYQAVIDEAHKNGYRTAAHVVLLDDAKGLLRAGWIILPTASVTAK